MAAATGLGIPQNQIHGAAPTGAGGVGGGGANSGGVYTPGLVPGGMGFMPATAAAVAAAAAAVSPDPVSDTLLPLAPSSAVTGGAGGMVAPGVGREAGDGGAAGMTRGLAAAAAAEGKQQWREGGTVAAMKSKEQAVRRRERNRVLARETRLRKKFFYESLLQRMAALRKDNRKFKTILRDRLGERAQQVVFDCTSELSRQVTVGSMEDAEGTDGGVTMTMVMTDMQVDAEVAAAAKGGGGKGTGSSKRGGGAGGGGGCAGASTRGLSRPDYRLVKSIEMVSGSNVE
ncbi:unnamed protein product [Ectocarpus sp. CCAP 1310/34]|nr:unnamed protein product [Ectocarpus sp. CCAP 1310/34]